MARNRYAAKSHWTFKDKPIEDIDILEIVGFVYQIRCRINDKKYIGKRATRHWDSRRKQWRTTTWRTYTGSSKSLNEDIKKHGKDKFEFEILHFSRTKAENSYKEMELQVKNRVMLRDDYYNGFMMYKGNKKNLIGMRDAKRR